MTYVSVQRKRKQTMCQSFKFRNYFQGGLKFNLNFFAFDLEQNESLVHMLKKLVRMRAFVSSIQLILHGYFSHQYGKNFSSVQAAHARG